MTDVIACVLKRVEYVYYFVTRYLRFSLTLQKNNIFLNYYQNVVSNSNCNSNSNPELVPLSI